MALALLRRLLQQSSKSQLQAFYVDIMPVVVAPASLTKTALVEDLLKTARSQHDNVCYAALPLFSCAALKQVILSEFPHVRSDSFDGR